MGLLNNVLNRIDDAKKQSEIEKEKRDIALKELRTKHAPILKVFARKYGAEIRFLDTDAYVYVVENGAERGIYIPYGTSEVQIDLRLDKLVNNIESASKHKTSRKVGSILAAGDNYASGGNNTNTSRGFWDNAPDMKDMNTNYLHRRF